jgi:hypothetical protein
MRYLATGLIVIVLAATGTLAHAGPIRDTPAAERDMLISLGARIHGGFGSLIAVGIRIGDDARQQLQAAPRDLVVTYYSGKQAPCPCVADGVMIATSTSPGQRSMQVASEPAPDGEFGRVIVMHKPGNRRLEYVIPQAAAPGLLAANSGAPVERWNAIMNLPEDQVFTRREITLQQEGK